MKIENLQNKKEIIKGVYSIVNMKTGHTYIGISQNIYERWNRHIYNLKNNKHHQKNLQKEFNKHGIESFDFFILETFNVYVESIVKQLEDYYILDYRNKGLGFGQKTNLEIGENYRNSIAINSKKETKEYFYMNLEEIERMELSSQVLFRLMFLASHMDYKNTIKLNIGGKNRNVSKKDLMDILNISSRRNYETIKELFDKEILYIKNEEIKISTKIFQRGKIYNGAYKYVKIYNEFVKDVYKRSSTNEHKPLGHIFKLLKYRHKETNVLCFNPTEEVYSNIKPLKKKDMLEILNRKNKNTDILNKFLFKGNGYGLNNFYLLNPNFSYDGFNFEELNIEIVNDDYKEAC